MLTEEKELDMDAMTKVTVYLANDKGTAVDMNDSDFSDAVAAISQNKLALFRDMNTGEETWIPPHAIAFVNRQSPRMLEQRKARQALAQSGGQARR